MPLTPEQRQAALQHDLALARAAEAIPVRKAWIGWWVAGEWCPTRKIREHRIDKLAAAALGETPEREADDG